MRNTLFPGGRKLFLTVCLCLAGLILTPSCASIVSKSSTQVGVDTSPQGADIRIVDRNGAEVYRGRTPANIKLKNSVGFFRKAEYKVSLTLDGYQTKEVVVEAGINGWYFGNLIFGGVIGFLIVDPATGAMYKLKKDLVSETLSPVGSKASSSGTPSSLSIISINDLSPEQRAELVPLP